MVEFCLQQPYWRTETTTYHVWLQMAWMEVDCNLKKVAKFFKLFLCISEKSLENNYSLFFRQENFSIFFPVLCEQFHVKKQALCQIFERF